MKNFSLLHREVTLCCILKSSCFTLCLMHYSHSIYAPWQFLYCRVYVYSISSLECKRKKKIQRTVNLCKWETKKMGARDISAEGRGARTGEMWRQEDTREKGGTREVAWAGLEQRYTHSSADVQKKTQRGYASETFAGGRGVNARGVETETRRSKRKAITAHWAKSRVPQCLTQVTEAQKWGGEVSRGKLGCFP